METGIHNTSEIGRLRKVLLHRPGQELENLMPEYLERLLFDDIPYLKEAQAEHDAFAQCLRDAGVEVVYLIDLVVNSLTSPEVRQELVTQFLKEADLPDEAAGKAVAEYLSELDDRAMVSAMMAGIRRSDLRKQGGRLSDHLSGLEEGYPFAVDPMPNLYFTRDPFAVVGEGVNLNRMYSVTRNRETLYGKYVFKYHPDYKDVSLYFRRDCQFHTEGGDVLNINEKTLAVGISQRTQAAAIDVMAQNIFWNSDSKVERILAFDIPVSRAFMHLDTVFTQIDVDKFTIHPAIMGTLRVYELTAGKNPGDVNIRLIEDTLEHVLEDATGVDQVKLIPCGGGDPIAASREQWNDGSNTLCVEPGKICVYARNTVTNDVLYKEGLDLLVVPSAELSRGRGGPRCMSMPFWREDL